VRDEGVSYEGTSLDPLNGPAVSAMPWLRSYRDVVEVFRSRAFVQGGGGRRDSAPITGYGVLALAGRDHFERRRIEAALFRKDMLRWFERDVLAPALAAKLADVTRPGRGGRTRTDLLAFLRAVYCDLTCSFWGIDGIDAPAARQRFLAAVDRMTPGGAVEWERGNHREIVGPCVVAQRDFAAAYVRPAMRRREALIEAHVAGLVAESELPKDLLTVMLRNKAHFEKWDSEVYVRELTLFAPGDTIVRFVPHMVAEMHAWVRAHPEDRARLEDVSFLRRCAVESLRLHPASPYFIRRAVQDTTLASGRRFRSGEYVVLDVTTASLDPEVFGADAGRFDPHRVPRYKVKPMGLAFGEGPHTCIGAVMSVGEISARHPGPDDPVGLVPYTLRELFRAGITPGAGRSARLNPANARKEFTAFPVSFSAVRSARPDAPSGSPSTTPSGSPSATPSGSPSTTPVP
jgi:cytochrome P450